uniref:J domain-containing protein n=1 Tax=Zea mays TaxID=4577 RepID=A0A804LHT3_MAIZE
MVTFEQKGVERWEKRMEMLDRLGSRLEVMEADQLRLKEQADRVATATRKVEAMSSKKKMKGTLEWFNATTGSGFVTSVDHGEFLYFLQPSLKSHELSGDQNLKIGEAVEFGIMGDSWNNNLDWVVENSDDDHSGHSCGPVLLEMLQGIWEGLKSDFLEDFLIPEGYDFIMMLQCVAQDHLPRWKTLLPFVELWYRPDKNASNPEASELFKEVAYSYNILSDPEKQRQYDNVEFEALENEGVDMEIELSHLGTVNKCLQHVFLQTWCSSEDHNIFYCAGKGHEWYSYGETTPCWNISYGKS